MCYGGGARAAGKGEGVEWGQCLVDFVDGLLELGDVFFCYCGEWLASGRVGGSGEDGAEGEEVGLGVLEQCVGVGVVDVGDEEADAGVEFVHCAIGFDAGVGFVHSFSAAQACCSVVAASGVDIAFGHVLCVWSEVDDVVLCWLGVVVEDEAEVVEVEGYG